MLGTADVLQMNRMQSRVQLRCAALPEGESMRSPGDRLETQGR